MACIAEYSSVVSMGSGADNAETVTDGFEAFSPDGLVSGRAEVT